MSTATSPVWRSQISSAEPEGAAPRPGRNQPEAHEFARALADRISEILPPRVTVRPRGGSIAFLGDGGVWVSSDMPMVIGDDGDGDTLARRLESAAVAVLGDIQDFAMHHLTVQWPLDASGELAMPNVRADDLSLHMWFGESEATAVIRLRPIRYDEIAGA